MLIVCWRLLRCPAKWAHLQKPVWLTFSLCEEQGESVEEKRYVHHTPQGGAESLAAFLGGRAGAASLRFFRTCRSSVPPCKNKRKSEKARENLHVRKKCCNFAGENGVSVFP